MAEHPRITLDSQVMVGKPVIRGTRITVELVIALLAEGWTEQDILAAYPHLAREDILACLAYAQTPKTIPHAFGFRPGIDLDKLNQLVDDLEAATYAAGQRSSARRWQAARHDPPRRRRPRS